MEGLGLEKTEPSVCTRCKRRFQCYTSRDSYDGLCNPDNFSQLDSETVSKIRMEKAKRQGHFVGSNGGH